MKMMRVAAVVALAIMLCPLALSGQQDGEAPDHWAPLRQLLGTWQGGDRTSRATSHVTHVYEFVLGDTFIRSRALAVFDPGEGEAIGEVHEDVGYFSYDSDRSVLVFRQFLSEGFVNTYVLEDSGPDALVFVSEARESAGGMRARLTFRFAGRGRYDLALDLASPGKDYWTCQQLTMRRAAEAAEDTSG